MIVKNLSDISFDKLLDCFLLAFQNYFVKMPTEKDYYKQRWTASKVNFNFSYGMFDEGKLVGFIIHAIDTRNGILTAYNTGTGVIPNYRGKRIVKLIYDFALKDLKQNHIKKSTLEVITKNEVALKSYKSIGFVICKKYNCFNGTIHIENYSSFELKKIDVKNIDWNSLPNQQFYSWGNQKESILRGNYNFFQVLNDKKPESYFIIKPDNGYLAQFDVLNTENNGWNRLFSAIKEISSTIKINNVDERLKNKLDNLNAIGLKNVVDQYEMELNIKNYN